MTEDQEKMWRALKDEKMMQPRRCRFGFHRWTVWELSAINTRDSKWSGWLHFTIIPTLYTSTCAECGKKKFKSTWEPEAIHRK